VPATINGLPPGSAQRPRLLRSSERKDPLERLGKAGKGHGSITSCPDS
jgi:hypothetical protein